MDSPAPRVSDDSTPNCLGCGAPLTDGQCLRCLLSLGGEHYAEDAGLPVPMAGRVFGDFVLNEEISRGGMGVVFRAQQRSLQREVALKLMLGGELSGAAARRMFQTEALAAAALHHPNMVAVYDTGECDLQPYLAMRLVPGRRNIAQWAAEHRAAASWRLITEKAALVARAVAHAHDRGVLHRDLKPSNILWDAEAGPQVTDFGLAKLLNTTGDHVTLTAQMLGSPGYMAPEQTGEGGEEITTATDVYGLGAVLYELLSGQPPFMAKSAIETIRKVREESPPPLKQAPRDLATVCFKCLSRRPQDRYASAAALAEELERFARGEPVLAAPLPLFPRLWRWAKRKPAIAALLSVSTLAVIGGVSGVIWQWRKVESARRDQAAALETAQIANAAQEKTLRHLRWQEIDRHLERRDASGALALTASFLREDPSRWQAAMYGMAIVDQTPFPIPAGPPILVPGGVGACILSADGRHIASVNAQHEVEIRDVKTRQVMVSFAHPPEGTPRLPIKTLASIAQAEGPPLLAAGGDGGWLTVRPFSTGEATRYEGGNASSVFREAGFGDHGTLLWARSERTLRVWRLGEPDKPLASFNMPTSLYGAAVARDAPVALLWSGGALEVRSVTDGKVLFSQDTNRAFVRASLSGSGDRVAFVEAGVGTQVVDVTSGRRLCLIEDRHHANFRMVLDVSGTRLMTSGSTLPLQLYDVVSGLSVGPPLRTHRDTGFEAMAPQNNLQLAMENGVAASTGYDSTVCLWDMQTGAPRLAPIRLGTGGRTPGLSLSGDGSVILTFQNRDLPDGEAGLLEIWKATKPREPQLLPRLNERSQVNSDALCHQGKLTAWMEWSHTGERRISVAETDTGKVICAMPPPPGCDAGAPMISPDGKRLYCLLLSLSSEGKVQHFAACWNIGNPEPLWRTDLPAGEFEAAALAPDGSRLGFGFSVPPADEVRHFAFLNAETGELLQRDSGATGGAVLRFSPDSRTLLTAGLRAVAELRDTTTGKVIRKLEVTGKDITTAAWSPDSRSVVLGAMGEVLVFSAEDGSRLYAPLPHPSWLGHVCFRPDGKAFATACRDGSLQLRDARTGQQLSSVRSQGNNADTVLFTADSRFFMARDSAGFRFWDGSDGEPLTPHFAAPNVGVGTSDCENFRSMLTPDGSTFLVGTGRTEPALQRVSVPAGRAPEWFPDIFDFLAQQPKVFDGKPVVLPGTIIHQLREMLAACPEDEYVKWARRVLGE